MRLRYYQDEAVSATFDYFQTHGGTASDGRPIKANPLVLMPTGTGKSVVIAKTAHDALMMHPNTRILMLTHVKELIDQNADKLLGAWPSAPLGIYSSGLGRRDTRLPIIYAGVQSIVHSLEDFDAFDLIMVDEAHLIGDADQARYLKVLEYFTKLNPYVKVIGYTATGYRLGMGGLTNGGLFTDICYDLTTVEAFNRLIGEGYLAPLFPRPMTTKLDTSGVTRGSSGDFKEKELQAAVDNEETNYRALAEAVNYGHDRHCWLVFASGIDHAEHLTAMLSTSFGIEAVCNHSKMKKKQLDDNMAAWKGGQVKAMVSMNKLTTGVDHPPIDMIIMLRPTLSSVLWVQMLGRGTRPYDYRNPSDVDPIAFPYIKRDCLVLDYAGNTARLGPINDPVVPKPKGQGTGDAPVRLCPECGFYNHASARNCIVCNYEFTFEEKLNAEAAAQELLRGEQAVVETFEVNRVIYSPHTAKKTGDSFIKASFFCGFKTFYQYFTVEGRNGWRGRQYVQRCFGDPPEGVTNAMVLEHVANFRAPRHIRVVTNQQYPEVISYEF